MKLALVGDIGGTNARFALWKNQQLESVQVLATADHASPEEAIALYLSGLGLAPGSIGSVCLSVAGPVSGDEFKFTNNHWRLSRKGFCKALQVDQLLLVNDFSAPSLDSSASFKAFSFSRKTFSVTLLVSRARAMRSSTFMKSLVAVSTDFL